MSSGLSFLTTMPCATNSTRMHKTHMCCQAPLTPSLHFSLTCQADQAACMLHDGRCQRTASLTSFMQGNHLLSHPTQHSTPQHSNRHRGANYARV